MVLEELLGRLATLTQAHIAHGEPCAGLVHDAVFDAQIDQLACARNALAVHNVELGLLKRGRDLVFDHLDTGVAADHLGAVFQVLHAAHIQAHGCIELKRAAAGRHLRAAVDHAHLFAQLVDENRHAVALGDRARQLAHGLAHHAGVQADKRVAHFALNLGARGERGDRVDDHDVDRARAHERFGNVQALLAGVRLGNQQAIDIHAERLRINRVERVLRVDKRGRAAHFLRLGNAVQRDCGFTRGLRAVDLDNTAARQAADAEREVKADRTGRDVIDLHTGVFAQTHDRAFAELLFYLADRSFERFLFIGRGRDRFKGFFGSHKYPPAQTFSLCPLYQHTNLNAMILSKICSIFFRLSFGHSRARRAFYPGARRAPVPPPRALCPAT